MKKDTYLVTSFDAESGLYVFLATPDDFRASGLSHLADLIGGRQHLVRRRGHYYDAVAWSESEDHDELGYYTTTRHTWRYVPGGSEGSAFGGCMTASDILWDMTRHNAHDLRMYAEGEYGVYGDDDAIEILCEAAAELLHTQAS
ncbi:MAG: hypothetical protein IJV70_07200 [Clostridia bacterium]|nr:hypothetical protein [Clostridia bacterium]